jgi:hypothetical protein
MNARRLTGVLLALFLVLLATSGTTAAPAMQVSPPGRLTYQGHLMDESGNAVPDGEYVMAFSLYDAPTAGSLLWGPETHTVEVDDGYFAALLGRDDAIGADDLASDTYLEIEVGGETMTPRHRLTSVAFALVAASAETCESVSGVWSLTGNADTTPGTHFVGTTDNQALELHVNGARALRLEPYANGPNVIGGHSGNSVTSGAYGVTISGGYTNTVTTEAYYATVGGGYGNTAGAMYATVGGGEGNLASYAHSVVCGGWDNTASYSRATVAGGQENTASNIAAFVGGGYDNTASGVDSSVLGGAHNTASGYGATVAGGVSNTAAGDYSLAIGRRAQAGHDGALVWGDSTDADVSSSAANQLVVRASGGVSMYTSSNLSTGAYLAAGSGSWSSMSDRDVKENFQPVDGQEVLDLLAGLEITTWNYTAQPDGVRHVGPMAQDFYAAFGLGETDRAISTVDADGVALAAIQALYLRVLELENQVSACRCQEVGR